METFVYKISHLCLLTFLMPLKKSKQCENSFSSKLNKDFFNVRYLSIQSKQFTERNWLESSSEQLYRNLTKLNSNAFYQIQE